MAAATDVTPRRHDPTSRPAPRTSPPQRHPRRHAGTAGRLIFPSRSRLAQQVVPGWRGKSFRAGVASRFEPARANLSAPCILSATALPPSKSLECMPAGGETPLNPMIFPEPSDYTGLAKVRQHATIPALAETNPEMAPEIIDEAPSIRSSKIRLDNNFKNDPVEKKGKGTERRGGASD
ncbi:hypothetical protein DAPPUDRAFT_266208 [Daphnia pulex]|uniref:Uncharacterized protein n=1 Tax=Daphnia pulex TaxID=6669 RepID=E9HUN2_DAPPU|nr:hypothetical protein DAPPUDRAFT_266208 [Daphnia pulex]|eukprot:EFX64541.1 hypothetical protein DAPPUDRAFT_266208 [Daphnia pulex]